MCLQNIYHYKINIKFNYINEILDQKCLHHMEDEIKKVHVKVERHLLKKTAYHFRDVFIY